MSTPVLSILALAIPPLAAGDVALFTGPPGGVGDVATVDEAGGAVPSPVSGLTGVRLLAADFTGRTEATRFFPDRPRRHGLPSGGARLSLQGPRGSLYEFARDEAAGGASFGFFLVDPQGAVRVVWERPGTGPAGDVDPFVDRVAVSPSGDSFLVATTLEAGGDLIEVDLATGAAIDRTSAVPPQVFGGAGLALHDAWGVGVGTAQVWRFDRATSADAQPVPFPGGTPPPYLARELVLSAGGTHAATIAGASAQMADVYVFAQTGAAGRASQTPGPLSGAGFLPDAEGGPLLFVTDDGSLAGWRTEAATNEIWLARVEPMAGEVPEFHVTNAPDFTDTGTEAGVLPPLAGTSMYMTWGEPGDPNDPDEAFIQSTDFFRVDLAAGSNTPAFTNLSGTSGHSQPPFDSLGTITPSVLHWLPQANAFFVFDELSGGTGRIVSIDAAGGLQVHMTDVRSVPMVDLVGSDLVFVAHRDLDPRPLELHRMPADLSAPPTLLLTRPDNDEELRYTVRPDGRLGIVFPDPAGPSETLWRVHVPAGVAKLFLNRHLRYGTTLDFAPGGALLATVGVEGFPVTYVAWPFGARPLRLFPMRTGGFLLPA